MSSSREESPDWLRSFQAPTVKSEFDSSPRDSPSREEDHKDPSLTEVSSSLEIDKSQNEVLGGDAKKSPSKKKLKQISPKKKLKADNTSSRKKDVDSAVKTEGNDDDLEVPKEETSDKHIEHHVSTSSLPLMLSEKVHRTKALVECEGESIDLSGDMGAVGRIVAPDKLSGNHDMHMDLKGTIYKTTIVPSRTFCVVSFGQSEAKIEAIMNDFIQLKPQSNVYESETMVEGTLDGFSFESEDESDRILKANTHQVNQSEDTENKITGKGKGTAEKKTGVAKKRGKTTGVKPPPAKKAKKKSVTSKKSKPKK